ncbi:TPA: DEAD/DEAH box helicase [Acinetobacter baumannii]|uniref:DEAD/DEAH box helicase n=26 Tax=Acinetobacter baumannii TaxID=470 RepID=A0AAX1IXQ4_ACIBA|nr:MULTISPECIES: DEAD/DEAH box helicase [Acinetobacter]EMT94277.1 ATP-dependent RNA helicase [Acinetobacter baumannii ABNIH5]ETY68312.1 DEAD/DEAH box helicase [Acinetobacter baumannii MDR_MMC4]EXB14537.1 helicase domain protein [Acinetobacter baumannii 1397084]EXC95781.1 helicase domain protein [Acinetobacter baumannii 1051830]EXD25765.1 helicase domain protein [Acinetobacter baumannii 34654]EYD11864.1 helicase domain protein [Acinetobacter baumannii 44362_2]KCW31152.1 helicase domain protei
MSKTFAEFSLHETLQQALEGLGFTNPTPVQEQSIPAALEGKDLLVSSQTGSGKTAAFLLPTLHNLAGQDTFVPFKERMKAVTQPSILVLCPTRELAQQVSQDAIAFVRHMKGVRIAAIMGGMPFGKQIQQLKGAQVVVATPGRLLDLVNRRQLKLDKVDALIVDEADRMLDLGFSEDLEAISDLAANRGQTLMFSATFADRIIRLAERMMNEPERIAIETGHSTNTDITQTLHWTDGFEHKKKLLTHWLADETLDQAVVFASTQEDTDMLAEELAEAGHSVVALHGAMPQTVRNRRLRSIREGRAKILVATDVAARGLDVPTISHVINFGLPMKHEDYVHRIGRTGRAGRTGQAITLATYRERGKIRALEDYLEARLNVSEIEGLEPSPPPARPRREGGRGGNGGRDGRRGGGFGGGRRFEGEGNFKRREGGRDDRPRRSFDDKPRGERPAFGGEDRPRREFNSDRPRREGGFEDRPRRSFGGEDRPRREFNSDRPRREGGFEDRPKRSFGGEDRPRREFNSDRPRREGGFNDKPRFDSNDDNRGNRVDYKPRRENGFGDRPQRSFGGEDRPRREGGFGDRPKRSFGGEERPRRAVREEHFNQESRGERRRKFDR